LDFCKKQKLKEAMMESVKLLKKSSFDEISDVLNQALKLGSDNNFGYDYKADFEQRFQFKSRDPVSTGWTEIDGITSGGLGKGELGVVIAPTGAGKSMALVHLGELASTVIGKRYDSCITGIMMNDVFSFKEEIYEKVTDLSGELIIKEYPTKSASPNDLKIHLEKLRKRDINVDMIIVDYGDLLKPNTIHKEKRIELERIYEHLRGLAQEFDCPCYTASQTNRSGLNAEVITMESISEAFNKCFVADFIFSLSRTIEDKNTNSGRVFVAKNRNGPDGLIYPIYMNTGNVKIKVLPATGETIGDIAVNSAKKQEKILKENYKNWKDKGKKE
jgi:energy-coupling factor transporter ATP-binding protein EcfA2